MRIFSLYLFKISSMPRRRRLRKIVEPPKFKGYKPYGHRGQKQAVELHYEEYEAIKLADYDHLNHQEASVLMGISRATFARIYDEARKKIAQALVETREIKSVFGHAYLDKSWFICQSCGSKFNTMPSADNKECPLCKSIEIKALTTK
jgi:predicted DNA-binding protein (UPF0251 family)